MDFATPRRLGPGITRFVPNLISLTDDALIRTWAAHKLTMEWVFHVSRFPHSTEGHALGSELDCFFCFLQILILEEHSDFFSDCWTRSNSFRLGNLATFNPRESPKYWGEEIESSLWVLVSAARKFFKN